MIDERVRKIVAEVLWVAPGELDGARKLVDYGLDSPTAIDLTVQLEDAFDIRIREGDAARLATVDDITAFVTEALG